MPISSMKCPKCGLTQMLGPACKSCGAPSPASGQSIFSPPPSRSAPPENPVKAAPLFESSSPAEPEPAVLKRDPVPSGPESADDEEELHVLRFLGRGGTLFGIQIVNLFLTLLTLGVYFFWGRVRIRTYLLGQTEFKEDRFAYHGTGRELLFGFLKAWIVFGAVVALLNAAPLLPGGVAVRAGAVTLAYTALAFFFPIAIVGSRRYRLSRTSWRGIRFSFRGDLKEFIKLYMIGNLLTFLTLGLYRPIFHAQQHGFLTSNSYFGGRRFEFDGSGRDLFSSYLLNLFLTVPTLGLSWFWYLAKRHRYYWSHTRFGEARFESTVTGLGYLGLTLVNVLLVVISLGLAWPWVTVRRVQFTARNLSLQGKVGLDTIQQDAQEATATGEGLGGLLDIESDFGIA